MAASTLALLASAGAAAAAAHALAATPVVYGLGGAGFLDGNVLTAIASINPMSGDAQWTHNFSIPYESSFCPGGFGQDAATGKVVYYTISEDYVTTFDAATGNQLHSVPVSVQGYDLVVSGFNPINGQVWGIGGIGEANFDFISVNVTSGKVDKVAVNIPFGSLSSCEGAAVPAPVATVASAGAGNLSSPSASAPASAPASAGAVYFVTQSNTDDTDELVRFDQGRKAWSKPVPWKEGDIWTVGAWYPTRTTGAGQQQEEVWVAAHPDAVASGAVPDHGLILADGKNATTVLVSVDPATGNTTTLLTLDHRYSAEQASLSFDVASGTAYAVIQGPASLVTYSVAVFNLTTSPPTAHYAHIPDSYSAQFGIASAAVFHGAA